MNGSAADGEEVVLLSDTLGPIGSMSKSSVHTTETPLHLAFSSYLFDRQGRLLLTRRA
ncbi:MAG: geranylgeranyl diphosphate synthase, type, partial [Kribbellaceae bacterium]|nr:geranylgeranyl diphosphate synthase, type [Kribbellaceae bacterium]